MFNQQGYIMKASRKQGAKLAKELRSQFQRYTKEARYFVVKAALAAENTPEARKAAKKLSDRWENRGGSTGLYWQPKGALSARA
jgi:hypothetical protein